MEAALNTKADLLKEYWYYMAMNEQARAKLEQKIIEEIKTQKHLIETFG
tara:strand:- start:309 stop:455 length:147 start_codon:yes stop_codon:yes gene_type:complete